MHCLLLEVSDAEMQVRGEGNTEVTLSSRSSGCAAVTLMLLLMAEHADQHLAAGDVLDVVDANKKQRRVAFLFMVPGKHPARTSFPVPTVCELLLCKLTILKANWMNLKSG